MSVNPSKQASLVAIQAQANFLNQGGAATLVFYDDTKPASTAVAANNSAKLVTLTFPNPALKEVTEDYVELHSTDAGTVIKAGTATWARLFNGDGIPVYDLAAGTDITLNNATLVLGSTLMGRTIKFRPPL